MIILVKALNLEKLQKLGTIFPRGAGGYWRTYKAQDLACPEAFQENPSLGYYYQLKVYFLQLLFNP